MLGAVLAFGNACGSNGGGSGTCTPGKQESCACPGGGQGIQVCNSDGKSLGSCQCDGATGGSTGGGNAGGSGGSGGGTFTQSGACGDGIQQPGECSPGEFYCAQDCSGTGSGGTGGGTTTNTCSGVVSYAGMVPNVPSVFGNAMGANGEVGLDAAKKLCQGIGADHMCDYLELKNDAAKGELSNVAQGTTFWVNRTTPEMVNGQVSQPGPGGRCNDWTYSTNHISDGEYATFDQVGVPTFHLDNDTVFDQNAPGVHTIQNDLQCGGVMRAIPCCFPACM
jgi:hypothetical protein